MPSQRPFRSSPDEPVFIGFAGRMGSGKTSAASYLSSKYRFQYIRYSQVLQEWREASGENREHLQRLGWDVMAGGLQGELNNRLIAALDRSRSAAIDGMRHRVDFDKLYSSFGFAFGMVFLEAGEERRYARLRQRFANFAAFQTADSHPVEASVDDLRPLAALTISNENSLDYLHQQLDKWITSGEEGLQR
jgi:dephospho-CoA kinase